jgi:hypothetical protein
MVGREGNAKCKKPQPGCGIIPVSGRFEPIILKTEFLIKRHRSQGPEFGMCFQRASSPLTGFCCETGISHTRRVTVLTVASRKTRKTFYGAGIHTILALGTLIMAMHLPHLGVSSSLQMRVLPENQ